MTSGAGMGGTIFIAATLATIVLTLMEMALEDKFLEVTLQDHGSRQDKTATVANDLENAFKGDLVTALTFL